MNDNPVSIEFFEEMYQKDPDPWCFGSSQYELSRYEEIIATLGGEHFHRAFEPGCSIGILTERLAAFCDRVIAIDISPTAVARARARCNPYSGVTIEEGALPSALLSGDFDLIVLSEIGYYFDEVALSVLARELVVHLTHGGTLLACHWLGFSPDHILHGDQVHAVLKELPQLNPVTSNRYRGFRIDSWSHS
jgi:SAM-dependent methyltransferase